MKFAFDECEFLLVSSHPYSVCLYISQSHTLHVDRCVSMQRTVPAGCVWDKLTFLTDLQSSKVFLSRPGYVACVYVIIVLLSLPLLYNCCSSSLLSVCDL